MRTVVHTGLPSTVESYNQEDGRAGRDGFPSRAILLYSYGDLRTHEFFLGRDYPEPEVLERLFRVLRRDPIPLAPRQRPPVIPHMSATGRTGWPGQGCSATTGHR